MNDKKRIVIVNDCAHVMEDLIPHLTDQFDIDFIQRTRGLWSKTFGILLKVLKAKGDLIHVNYALQDAYLVDKLKGSLDILHVHGSGVRTTLNTKKWGWIVRNNLRNARHVLYSTPDLEDIVKEYQPDAEYLPTPVKTDVFKKKETYNDPPRAVYFKLWYEKLPPELIGLFEKNGIDLTVKNRDVPYAMMPETLTQYDIYVDRYTIPSLSKTCLEAMSCGLSTINYRHFNDFPKIVKQLSGASTLRENGEANSKYVEKNHSAPMIADKLVKIWEERL